MQYAPNLRKFYFEIRRVGEFKFVNGIRNFKWASSLPEGIICRLKTSKPQVFGLCRLPNLTRIRVIKSNLHKCNPTGFEEVQVLNARTACTP